MTLPLYYSLEKAAKMYNLPLERLNNWLECGKLDAIQNQAGEILVSSKSIEDNLTKAEIINQHYADLVGVPITLKDAAEKYGVHKQTIYGWVKYYKYVRILRKGYKIEVDEADVAYCANIYQKRQQSGLGTSGAPLLHKDGRPYRLKRKDVAMYRKRKRETEPA